MIFKIPNEDTRLEGDHWRGICALSLPRKILCTYNNPETLHRAPRKFGRQGAGWFPLGSIDHIHTVRIILELCLKFRFQLRLLFVDFEVSVDFDTEQNVARRISTTSAYAAFSQMWKCGHLNICNIRLFCASVLFVLPYGNNTWNVTTTVNQKLQSFSNPYLQRIIGTHWPDTISNK